MKYHADSFPLSKAGIHARLYRGLQSALTSTEPSTAGCRGAESTSFIIQSIDFHDF